MKLGTKEHFEIEAGKSMLGRRSLLKGVAGVLGGVAVAPALPSFGASIHIASKDKAKATSEGRSVIASAEDAMVETNSGKVAGYVRKGIYTFKGIPYADTTEGANRFMSPAKPKPWTGVRSSRQFGHVAPQGPRAGWANDEEAFLFSWDDGVQGAAGERVDSGAGWQETACDGMAAWRRVHSRIGAGTAIV